MSRLRTPRRDPALRAFWRDTGGVTVVEFAVVAPVMLLTVFGLMELTFQAYVQSTLDGAVNAAARKATTENKASDQKALDAKVVQQVQTVVRTAQLTFERKNYQTVGDIGEPEIFTDSASGPKKNGRFDPGECFVDYNRNGRWDADRARSGQGGADDFIQYTATARYKRLFPMAMFGLPATAELTSLSVLRNQPYAGQGSASKQQVC